MIYGYARCSTNEERQDIDRQRRELKALGVEDKHIYWEYMSGTREDRPELAKLLEIVKAGDTIAATEVSRLSRSTRQLCDIIKFVQDHKLILNIGGTFVADCSNSEMDPMTAGMLRMWSVFSEMEHDIIRQRVISGLKNAAAKGKKFGRPPLTKDNIPDKFWKYYAAHKNGQMNISEMSRIMSISRTTVYKYIRLAEKE